MNDMDEATAGARRGDEKGQGAAADQPTELFARRLRTPRAAALAGIVFALLFAVSTALVEIAITTDPADAGDWLRDSERKDMVRLSFNLVPFAGIAFLWFIGVIRDRLGHLEDRFFSTVFLGSGLLFIALLFASTAYGTGLFFSFDSAPETEWERILWRSDRRTIFTLVNTYAMRMAAVFTISVCTIALRTAILHRWLVYLGYVIALVLFLGVAVYFWTALLFPLWIFLISVNVLFSNMRGRQKWPESGARSALPE